MNKISMTIRSYSTADYPQVASLYKQGDLYGGQLDTNRDSAERLQTRIESDPQAILVAEHEGKIYGTISLIEDGRVAWLFRFAVARGEYEATATNLLYQEAVAVLKSRGHKQVLVYSPTGNTVLDGRYEDLGFVRGSDYTCYWQDL